MVAKYSLFNFIFVFILLVSLFYLATFTPFFNSHLFNQYLSFQAYTTYLILNLLGQDITLTNTVISTSQDFAIQIVRGCDALEPTVLFIAAIIAFPAPLAMKLWGIVMGALTILVLNFIRIISLFFIGIYYPQLFDVMHLDVWQALFILLSLLLFVIWLQWVGQRLRKMHVSAT